MMMAEEIGLAFPQKLDFLLASAAFGIEIVIAILVACWAHFVLVTRRRTINRLRELLASVSEEDEALQYVLVNINVSTLIQVGGWHIEDSFMRALEEKTLDTLSKAIMIDGLQKDGLDARQQIMVRDLFLSCQGHELVYLKTLIDGSGGYRNLYKLVFRDISDRQTRKDILDYFAKEGKAFRGEIGSVGVKVVSDLDDTLVSSGGLFPAGCDTSYPRHCIYPGCLKFYECLDKGFQPGEPSCNLVFLTARPHLYRDLAEEASFRNFKIHVSDGRMHSMPTLLTGKLLSGMWATLTWRCSGVKAWRLVGDDKFNTFTLFKTLYPEYDFVFCGDDGQGDLLAGQRMLQDNDDGLCRAVVIHHVLKSCEPLSLESESDLSSDDDDSISSSMHSCCITHKTYVGAAVDMHSLDAEIFPIDKVVAVAQAAIDEFDTAVLSNKKWYQSLEGSMAHVHLQADLQRAQELVGPDVNLELGSREQHLKNIELPKRSRRSSCWRAHRTDESDHAAL
eukprot:TRINITY_DN40911_c0_g1_i1.p1 TRINITY_DN40911_c0_g1~~TRINITY_DN40911_c0_g1_i1.p1  ORF type:complete len:506 (+),score=97.37 TRINITY_DN40911_c0_g1_i1:698-2215(+)